jgi:hypothetical protein
LRHYFESHPVTVVSSFPLGEIIQCREASGRITKWAVEIMGETVSHPVLKANRMRTMYVPGSVIHVHSDYINDSS